MCVNICRLLCPRIWRTRRIWRNYCMELPMQMWNVCSRRWKARIGQRWTSEPWRDWIRNCSMCCRSSTIGWSRRACSIFSSQKKSSGWRVRRMCLRSGSKRTSVNISRSWLLCLSWTASRLSLTVPCMKSTSWSLTRMPSLKPSVSVSNTWANSLTKSMTIMMC